MIKLSVIIVNYNVQYFIEQAIKSVEKAAKNISYEIIVIDNNSKDQSVKMIEEQFPTIKLIANKDNVGFGKANNQGIQIAKGEFILLLNPDTVLQENTIENCINWMNKHEKCGAIGVKMIDGKGNFLPESKRALPTPKVAFFKMTGLSSLFPKSKLFGQYHLGYLDYNQNHQVAILSGAFMFFRGSLLKEIGGFDEDYFMYGEDIDLSYQVLKKGYKNYYLADTSIIHYKGESTKKGSLNYVKVFYEAMLIFAKKHFSTSQATLFQIGIYFAIFFKGALTILQNFFKKSGIFLLDFSFSWLTIWSIAKLWAIATKDAVDYYPSLFLFAILPIYVIVWLFNGLLFGAYEKPYKIIPIWKSVILGTLITAAFYGFLPNDLRFSRAILLLGAIGTGIVMMMTRLFYHVFNEKKWKVQLTENARILIIGNENESNRASQLLRESGITYELIGAINYGEEEIGSNNLGTYDNLIDLAAIHQADELIFCSKDIPLMKIISSMNQLGNTYNYKILPENSMSIIGSNSKNTAGDLYAIDVNLRLSNPRAKLIKRSFDILFSILTPFFFFFVEKKGSFLKNSLAVFLGKKTWVGYCDDANNEYLPKIKKGVLCPLSNSIKKGLPASQANLLYAKNYSLENDLVILIQSIKQLGN